MVSEEVIREGNKAEEILRLIEEDEDVAILVLGAATDAKGPGPLVSSFAAGRAAGNFPIPIAIVPGRSRSRTSARWPEAARQRSLDFPISLSYLSGTILIRFVPRAMCADGSPKEPCDVHPDRSDTEPGNAQVHPRQARAR